MQKKCVLTLVERSRAQNVPAVTPLLLCLLSLTALANEQTPGVYRCVENTGRQTFQSTPCLTGTQIFNDESCLSPAEVKRQAQQTEATKSGRAPVPKTSRPPLAVCAPRFAEKDRVCNGSIEMSPTLGVDLDVFRTCRGIAWAPKSVHTVQTVLGTTEYWHLVGGGLLVFTNRKLTSISN